MELWLSISVRLAIYLWDQNRVLACQPDSLANLHQNVNILIANSLHKYQMAIISYWIQQPHIKVLLHIIAILAIKSMAAQPWAVMSMNAGMDRPHVVSLFFVPLQFLQQTDMLL